MGGSCLAARGPQLESYVLSLTVKTSSQNLDLTLKNYLSIMPSRKYILYSALMCQAERQAKGVANR